MNRPILGLCVGIVAVVLAVSTRDVWTIDPDAAAYVGLGRALAAGHGYTLQGEGGALHGKYPPGLPLLVAALARAGGPEAYRLFHLALVVLLAAGVLVAHRLLLRLGAGTRAAAVIALCTLLSQTFFDLSVVYLRTEVPFLLLTLGALLAMAGRPPAEGADGDGAGRLDPALPLPAARVALASLLIVGAVLTRTAGIALAAVPAWRLVRPGSPVGVRLQSALLVAAALLPLLLWRPVTGALAGNAPADGATASYASELLATEPRDLTKVVQLDNPLLDAAGLARRAVTNVEVLARACATLLTNVDRAAHRLPVGALLLLLVAVGALDLLRRPGPAREAALFLGATIGLYLIWPFNQQERFYAPLLPLLLLAAGRGLVATGGAAARASGSSAGRAALRLGAVAVLAVLALQRSDHPVVLGRWSIEYTGLLAVVAVGCVAMIVGVGRGLAPRWPAAAAWVPLMLFAVVFAAKVGREWPGQVEAFAERRAAAPVDGALQRIDTHPLLERAALFLRDETPADAVVMTDVPKMMTILSGRRCVPFVFRADPPGVEPGDADYLFYTRELAAADAAMTAAAPDHEVALALRGEDGEVVASIHAVRRP